MTTPREAILNCAGEIDVAVFDRLAARMSYVSGDFGEPDTYQRVVRADGEAQCPVFYLEIPPFLFGRVIKGLTEAGLTNTGRVVVEKPFGHDLAVRASARGGDPPVHRRVPALPDRSLPGEDGDRGDPLSAVRQRDVRADLESQLRRERSDHDGRELRGRGPRPFLRPGRRAARRGRQPPDAGGGRGGDGGARRPAMPKCSRTRSCRAVPGHAARPIPRITCAGSTTATGRSTASRRTRPPRRIAALRLEIDNWRWSGVPFFIRTGKRLPVTQTELRVVFRHPPRLGFAGWSRVPEPSQFVVKLDPSTGIALAGRCPAPRGGRAGADQPRHGVRPGGRRGADALRGASPRCADRRQQALHPPGRRRAMLAGHGAALGEPPPAHPYVKGSWGPEAADQVLEGYGRWHEPWVGRHEHVQGQEGRAARRRPRGDRRRQGRRERCRRAPRCPRRSRRSPSYGFLSNCHTGALVAPDGAVDWLCVPALRLAERIRHRCSTGVPAASASARSGSTSRQTASTSRARTRWSRRGGRRPVGRSCATR